MHRGASKARKTQIPIMHHHFLERGHPGFGDAVGELGAEKEEEMAGRHFGFCFWSGMLTVLFFGGSFYITNGRWE